MYVAPPGVHLLVGIAAAGAVPASPAALLPALGRPAVRLHRPRFGRDTVAVVLTGRGCDGAEGAQMMRRMGGHVIVQDPETAEYADMPRAAVRAGAVDAVLPLGDIAGALRGAGRAPGAPA